MVDFLNDDVTFEGEVVADAELTVNGGLTIGPGGAHYGLPPSGLADTWPVYTRVRVADTTERTALAGWRTANAPISASNPLCVWRADGSSTGVQETTINGTDWYAESPLAGDVEMTLAATAPYGWLLLQGQTILNAEATYPALWAAASPALRSGTSLVLPDLRGRVPVGSGQGTGLTLRNFGTLFGAETVALSVANLPAHSHTGTTAGIDRSLNHYHRTRLGHLVGANPSGSGFNHEIHDPNGFTHDSSYVAGTADPGAGGDLQHAHGFTTNNTGDGTGHANVQPSAVVNFKVKV